MRIWIMFNTSANELNSIISSLNVSYYAKTFLEIIFIYIELVLSAVHYHNIVIEKMIQLIAAFTNCIHLLIHI